MTDRFDSGVAHPARRYNYWLGGKDNFAADRESGDLLAKSYPAARIAARANRAFLRRAVHHLAADAGIRQFLDIGTGLPTADNTHEVAHRPVGLILVAVVRFLARTRRPARWTRRSSGRSGRCACLDRWTTPGLICPRRRWTPPPGSCWAGG